MQVEYNALSKNKVCETVENNGAKTVGTRWLFSVKNSPTGETSKYKARFLAIDYCHVLRKDFNEMHSPTTKLSTFRLLVGLPAQSDSKLRQMDKKNCIS